MKILDKIILTLTWSLKISLGKGYDQVVGVGEEQGDNRGLKIALTWSWKVCIKGSNQGPKLLKKITFASMTICVPSLEQKSKSRKLTRERKVGCSSSSEITPACECVLNFISMYF